CLIPWCSSTSTLFPYTTLFRSYGDLVWVNTHASSCSEMIADLAFSFPDLLKMSNEAARLIYAGIVGDTGRFLYPATTSYTLEVRSEEHTSELQSRFDLVCRLLL